MFSDFILLITSPKTISPTLLSDEMKINMKTSAFWELINKKVQTLLKGQHLRTSIEVILYKDVSTLVMYSYKLITLVLSSL